MKRAGLCVGGPLRGQKIANQDSTIRIMERKAEVVRGARMDIVIPATETGYYWQPTALPSVYHGFWRHSSMSLETAMDELLGSYEREHSPKRG